MSNVPEVTIGKLSDTFAQPHRVSCALKYPEILFVLDPDTGLWRFQTTHATPTLAQEAAEILGIRHWFTIHVEAPEIPFHY